MLKKCPINRDLNVHVTKWFQLYWYVLLQLDFQKDSLKMILIEEVWKCTDFNGHARHSSVSTNLMFVVWSSTIGKKFFCIPCRSIGLTIPDHGSYKNPLIRIYEQELKVGLQGIRSTRKVGLQEK